MDTLPPEIIAMICAHLSRIPRAAARVAGVGVGPAVPIGRIDMINFAAEDGDIDTLEWAHARGFRTTACHRAANIETLQWLHAHGYNIARSAQHAVEINDSVGFGYILQIHPHARNDAFVIGAIIDNELIDFLHRIISIPGDPTLIDYCAHEAMKNTSVLCLEYLHLVGLSLKTISYSDAILHAHDYTILDYLYTHGYPPHEVDAEYAIKVGRLDVLQWIIDHGVVPDEDLITYAVLLRNTDCIKLLIGAGCPMGVSAPAAAISTGRTDHLRLLLSSGCPADSSLYRAADTDPAMIEILHEYNIPCDVQTLILAAKYGAMSTLKWYVTHGYGCPEMIEAAGMSRQIQRVRWLREHGCPFSPATVSKFYDKGLAEYADYLITSCGAQKLI